MLMPVQLQMVSGFWGMPKSYPTIGDKRIHRVRAELALGKPIPNGAHVHHADGSKSADAPLVICQDGAYHRLLHVRMRVVRAGGDPNTQRICGHCGRVKSIDDFHVRKRTGKQLRAYFDVQDLWFDCGV
jgi:hypothetical protein